MNTNVRNHGTQKSGKHQKTNRAPIIDSKEIDTYKRSDKILDKSSKISLVNNKNTQKDN